jgi:translation initiation factor 2 alpha subunit (eIF-2alpha)
MDLTSNDYKTAEKQMLELTDEITKVIKTNGCSGEVIK